MSRPLKVKKTTKLTLATGAAKAVAGPEKSGFVRVYASVGFHVLVEALNDSGGGVLVAGATTSNTPCDALKDYLFSIDPGQQVSVIVAEGETAGTVWVDDVILF